MPSSLYCVDSLKIFREIDEKREKLNQMNVEEEAEINTTESQENLPEFSVTSDPLDENTRINWQAINETTPRVVNKTNKRHNDAATVLKEHQSKKFKACRSLFSDVFTPQNKYPKKGEYTLGAIYERYFSEEPKNLHRAEADVEILTKLILHYGMDFLACAEERKELFSSIPKLGTRIH